MNTFTIIKTAYCINVPEFLYKSKLEMRKLLINGISEWKNFRMISKNNCMFFDFNIGVVKLFRNNVHKSARHDQDSRPQQGYKVYNKDSIEFYIKSISGGTTDVLIKKK
ncbi:MAG: hypothetical protein ABIP35_03245 [Ginsengibacter sp.]